MPEPQSSAAKMTVEIAADEADKTVHTSARPASTSSRPNPLGPHEQVVVGWLDDNGALLPDPSGLLYRRTFTDWEQVPDAVTTHEHEWSGWTPGSHSSRYRFCLDPTCGEGEIQ